MKTKLLGMMLLAGGSMFAQTRVSIGIGFGGHGAGFYSPPPVYASNIVARYWNRQPFSSEYQVAPRFDSRFNDGDHRQGLTRGFEQDQTRGVDRGRNLSGEDQDQPREFNQGQTSDFGNNQNQNQNRGFGNQDRGGTRDRSNGHDDHQDNHQGNGYASGFRGR